MKSRRPTPLDEVARRVSSVDPAIIDELYGLEPVYEPDGPAHTGSFATEFVSIVCPYCWETYETSIDLSAGTCTCIEDCQVCCQPIELTCEIEDGELRSVTPARMD